MEEILPLSFPISPNSFPIPGALNNFKVVSVKCHGVRHSHFEMIRNQCYFSATFTNIGFFGQLYGKLCIQGNLKWNRVNGLKNPKNTKTANSTFPRNFKASRIYFLDKVTYSTIYVCLNFFIYGKTKITNE